MTPGERPSPSRAGRLHPFAAGVGLTLLLALLVAAVTFRPFADLDFAWQIRHGEQVVQARSLHIADELTYTIDGKQLPDFEWLYEVVLYFVWCGTGYAGLHVLKVLCVLTPLALVAWRLRRENVGWHVVHSCLAVAILALIPMWNLRALYLTTVGMLLLSAWLRDHCVGRRALSWETPLLMLLWGNMHPGVITGQGLLLGAIAWEWLNRSLGWNTPLSRASCVRLTVVGGLGFLASLVCPDPLLRLQYTFDPNLRHPIMRGFLEMRPLHFYATNPPYLAGLIYVVLALVLFALVKRFRSFRLWEVALLAGTLVLGCYAYRSSQDLVMVWIAVGIPRLVEWYRAAAPRGVPRLVWRVERSAKNVLAAPAFRFNPRHALFLLALVPLAGLLPRTDVRDLPRSALDFIEEGDIRGNVFANANEGTYLVWRRGPERARCYVDTRGFYFPPSVLEDSHVVTNLQLGWQDRLDRILKADTDWLLLDARSPLGRLMNGESTPAFADTRSLLIDASSARAWLSARLAAPATATGRASRAVAATPSSLEK
jgi:hypothetical protein